jgi:hypothetical protein
MTGVFRRLPQSPQAVAGSILSKEYQRSSSRSLCACHKLLSSHHNRLYILVISEVHQWFVNTCKIVADADRLSGLVVRVHGYRSRGSGFDSDASRFSEK